MKRIKRLINRLEENFACGMSFIEIHGNSDLILSGCKKIIDYNSEQIICDTLSGRISIEGKCLVLDVFRGDMLTVCGSISGVYLNREYVC